MRKSNAGKYFLLILMVVGISFGVSADRETPVTITLLHLNDVHGNVDEGIGYGKITALVNNFREENPNTLLFDAGDSFHGHPIATHSQGERIAQLHNAMGFDVMTPGNHDFNYGWQRLLELGQMLEYPMLSANVTKDGKPLFEESMIFTLEDVRIGVFGLSTPDTTTQTHPKNVEGLEFGLPLERAKEIASQLRKKVDVLIVLGHLGSSSESPFSSLEVIEHVPGIDIFIDGHSHTAYSEGRLVGETLLVSSGSHCSHLGVVELVVENGVIQSKTARLIGKTDPLIGVVEEDEPVGGLVREFAKEVELLGDEVVGEAKIRLDGDRQQVRRGETNLGNLVTDAMRASTGADIGFLIGGSIRSSIEIGPITKDAVSKALPFDDRIQVKSLTGEGVLAILEHGLRYYPHENGAFPQVSGLNITFNEKALPGERVVDVQVNGQPLDPKGHYTVATSDFLAAGGDGFTQLKDSRTLAEGMLVSEAFAWHIKQLPEVAPIPEGRILPVIKVSLVLAPFFRK